MPKIVLSDATCRELRNLAILPFKSDAEPLPDGNWLVWIAEGTLERVETHRLPGESDDDVISRLLRLYRNDRPN